MSNIELYSDRNKIATALFAFFLGGFGAHRFYLGQTGRGLLYLLFFWTGFPFIIAFIDFILFLSMNDERFDRKFNPHLFQRQAVNHGNNWKVNLPPPHDPSANNNEQQAPSPSVQHNNEHEQLLREVGEIRNDIIRRIQSNKEFKRGIVGDIKPLVDNYIGQVRELIGRDQQVKQVIESHSMGDIDEKVFELNSKMTEASSPELKTEYKNSLDRYIQHKNSLKEFNEQREMIALRLDATLMSLREVKFDLVRLQNLNSEEQRIGFSKMFDEKSTELSDYLSSLKEAYKDNRID